MKHLLLCLALTLFWMMSPVEAAPIRNIHAAVPGLSGRTWLDLVKQAVPDAEPAEASIPGLTGREGMALRRLQDEPSGDWGETINIAGLDGEIFEVGGRKRIILALKLYDGDVAPLLLFDGEGEGKLLDAVDVRTDLHTSYDEPMTRALGKSGALVVSKGWHGNSNQSYRVNSLVLIGPEKFSFIGEFFVYGEADCRSQIIEKETIKLISTQPLAEIQISIAHQVAKLRNDCSTMIGKPRTKVVPGSFKWDATRNAYVGETQQLDALAKENEKRF